MVTLVLLRDLRVSARGHKEGRENKATFNFKKKNHRFQSVNTFYLGGKKISFLIV